MEQMKKCSKCKRNLPATSEYYFRDSKKVDGFFLSCKECEGYTFQDIKNKYKCKEGYKICRRCNKELPLNHDYFYYNAISSDGHDYSCRVCNGYQYGKTPKEGYKICIKCENELILNKDNFHKDNSSSDTFDSICKDCKFGRNTENFSIEKWYGERSQKFKNRWNFEDIKWMYVNYTTIGKQDLLKYFNNKISYKTLTNIIYQWNIKKQDKNDNWSDEDIEFLYNNYPNMPQKGLEEYFVGRTWDAIKNKTSKLGIQRDEETLVKIKSECQIGHKMSEEQKRKIGLRHKGSNNWNWKGGVSPIVVRLREYTIPWKLDSLKEFDYKCALSGINDGTLEVHHLNKNFSEIVYETFKILNLPINNDMSKYSQLETDLIRDKLLELHYLYGLGVPLTKKIHQNFHSIYGNRNNTEFQFEEFKNNYTNRKEMTI